MILSIAINLAVPRVAQYTSFLGERPSLMVSDASGNAVYFEKVVHEVTGDMASPMHGTGRFNFEVWLLGHANLKPTEMTSVQRDTAHFFVDGLLPFALLIAFSFVTKRGDKMSEDQFFGKMKTPVLPTRELEAAALEETRRNPGRYDHLKLLPGTNWEFIKWDKTDAVGFICCLAVSGTVVALFIFLLHLAVG